MMMAHRSRIEGSSVVFFAADMTNTPEPAVRAVDAEGTPSAGGQMIAYRNRLQKGISRTEHFRTVRLFPPMADSVVRLFAEARNCRTVELPNAFRPAGRDPQHLTDLQPEGEVT
jgi:hypothetical protein